MVNIYRWVSQEQRDADFQSRVITKLGKGRIQRTPEFSHCVELGLLPLQAPVDIVMRGEKAVNRSEQPVNADFC